MAHYGKSGKGYSKLGNNNPNRGSGSGGGGGAKIPAYSTAYSTDYAYLEPKK